MRLEWGRHIEKKLKGTYNRLWLRHRDFSIISNNCWGTFIYKKFNLPYQSPFINLFIFSEDYLKLLENFTPQILDSIKFIDHTESKYIEQLKERGHFGLSYPIGVIGKDIEIHFLHYKDATEAQHKWNERVKRINFDRLLFKFSDSEGATDKMIWQFDSLPFQHKICFTAKSFPHCSSVVYLSKFEGLERVRDEWKHSEKHYDLAGLLNRL